MKTRFSLFIIASLFSAHTSALSSLSETGPSATLDHAGLKSYKHSLNLQFDTAIITLGTVIDQVREKKTELFSIHEKAIQAYTTAITHLLEKQKELDTHHTSALETIKKVKQETPEGSLIATASLPSCQLESTIGILQDTSKKLTAAIEENNKKISEVTRQVTTILETTEKELQSKITKKDN